jgi:hypothetical protein
MLEIITKWVTRQDLVSEICRLAAMRIRQTFRLEYLPISYNLIFLLK